MPLTLTPAVPRPETPVRPVVSKVICPAGAATVRVTISPESGSDTVRVSSVPMRTDASSGERSAWPASVERLVISGAVLKCPS